MHRRQFLSTALLPLAACQPQADVSHISGGFTGIGHARGHLLQKAQAWHTPSRTRQTDVLIAGGGVAGLAAARGLRLKGVEDFALLELEDSAGGNSRAGQLGGMACPQGAHYLPLPGDDAWEVQDLLEELGLRRRLAGRWVASGRYLIERVAVSYAPSLSALREMRKVGQTRGASSSRLAMTGFGSAGLPPTAKADPSLAGLPPLVEAESQAVAIGKIYGPTRSQVFVGDAARQPRLATDAGHSRIVHVAAHAVLDDASPLHSFLLFSRKPNEPPDAGRVEAADLMRLDLSAELVVLSACDTGRGRVGEGEGLIGMSWSLFVAGAPSVVVSQWKVDSVSTTALMVDFHGRLNQYLISHGRVGQRAQALRQAALAMLKSGSYAHPFYWAPFVVVGDGL